MQETWKLIDHLNEKEFAKYGEISKNLDKELRIKIPNIFSISERPEIAIDFLRQLYKVLMTEQIKKIRKYRKNERERRTEHGDCIRTYND